MLQTKTAVKLIIIFHVVGLIGLAFPFSRPIFLFLVPFHLWLMALIVISSHRKVNAQFMGFVALLFLSGFIAEWIGVHTSWPFGDYHYGKTLGLKISGIPVVMGVNWLSLIYCTGVLMDYSPLKNRWLKVALGAVVLVLLDMLIEPVAMKLDYWHWANNRVPLNNYICWFAFNSLLLFVFGEFGFKKQSTVGIALLAAQFVFFGALAMIFKI
jgi:putative membrane protein